MSNCQRMVGSALSVVVLVGAASTASAASVRITADSDVALAVGGFSPAVAIVDADGAAIELSLGDGSIQPHDGGAALNFNLASLPAGATITSARLGLDMIGVDLGEPSDGVRAIVFANDGHLTLSDFSDPGAVISGEYAFARPGAAGLFELGFTGSTWFPGGPTLQDIIDDGASHLAVILQLDWFGIPGEDAASFVTTEGAAADATRFAPYLDLTYTAPDLQVVPTPGAAWLGAAAMLGMFGLNGLRRNRDA